MRLNGDHRPHDGLSSGYMVFIDRMNKLHEVEKQLSTA